MRPCRDATAARTVAIVVLLAADLVVCAADNDRTPGDGTPDRTAAEGVTDGAGHSAGASAEGHSEARPFAEDAGNVDDGDKKYSPGGDVDPNSVHELWKQGETIEECKAKMLEGDKFMQETPPNIPDARRRYFLALGPDPEGLLSTVLGEPQWAPPVTRLFAANYLLQLDNGDVKLNAWPSDEERKRHSDDFLKNAGLDGPWFKVYKGQKKARKLLPPMSRPRLFDYVDKIDDIAQFINQWPISNRPVLIGAQATHVLLGHLFPKKAKLWTAKNIMKQSKQKMRVGQIPYLEFFETKEYNKNETLAEEAARNWTLWLSGELPLPGCEEGREDSEECAIETTRFNYVRDRRNAYVTMKRYVQKIMKADTFKEFDNPDLRHTFSIGGRSLINAFGLELDLFPKFMKNVGPCPECPDDCHCKFQWYLAPAMAGSQIHEHRMAWNALVRGKKRWHVHVPGTDLDVLKNKTITDPVYVWARDTLPWLRQQGHHFDEFYQYPGEIVIIPDHWMHAIVNVEPSLGFAVEINHVDASTLPDK